MALLTGSVNLCNLSWGQYGSVYQIHNACVLCSGNPNICIKLPNRYTWKKWYVQGCAVHTHDSKELKRKKVYLNRGLVKEMINTHMMDYFANDTKGKGNL